MPSNTFAVYGQGQDKELTELVPGILNQLGPESLANLRKLAESYQSSWLLQSCALAGRNWPHVHIADQPCLVVQCKQACPTKSKRARVVKPTPTTRFLTWLRTLIRPQRCVSLSLLVLNLGAGMLAMNRLKLTKVLPNHRLAKSCQSPRCKRMNRDFSFVARRNSFEHSPWKPACCCADSSTSCL